MKKIAMIVAALMLASTTGCAAMYTPETKTCKVYSKDRAYHNGESQMRVYTTCGTYKVSDDLSINQWRSADIYGQIEPEHTYLITARGWRNGFFSQFPNITKAEKVK